MTTLTASTCVSRFYQLLYSRILTAISYNPDLLLKSPKSNLDKLVSTAFQRGTDKRSKTPRQHTNPSVSSRWSRQWVVKILFCTHLNLRLVLSGYRIQYRVSGTQTYHRRNIVITMEDDHDLATVSNLLPGQTYEFMITAIQGNDSVCGGE